MEFLPLIVECHKRENRELYTSLCNEEAGVLVFDFCCYWFFIFVVVVVVFGSQNYISQRSVACVYFSR